jgi:L-aminopeptidase/D-esterase-like protein
MNNDKSITNLKGVKVGHYQDKDKLQGISLIAFDTPYPVAYHSAGGTARVYDSTIMDDGKSYPSKHGIFITDGAHAGLEAGAFIAQRLREKGIGWNIHKTKIPSLTGATILSKGMFVAEFDPQIGSKVVDKLKENNNLSGNVGVGTGASVGKFSYTEEGECLAMKTGIGLANASFENGIQIYAMTVVNALGNVIKDGEVYAGNRNDKENPKFRKFNVFSNFLMDTSNTTISVVGTNAIMAQEDLRRIAKVASNGQVRTINPINTSIDGDTVFVFSTQKKEISFNEIGKDISSGDWFKLGIDIIGQASADIIQESIYHACESAETIPYKGAYKGIIPSINDY